MLDARAPIRRAGLIGLPMSSNQLRWNEDWFAATGSGVNLGLI